MLVLMRSLRLVILVFEKYLGFYGEKLLFVVGCWLWCDHYIWSYWFLLCLVGTAVISSFWSHACCLCDLYGWLLRFFFGCSLQCYELWLLLTVYLVIWYLCLYWSVFSFSWVYSGLLWIRREYFILSYFEAKLQKPGWTGAPGKPCGLFDFTQP